jgi:hypothetical protein
MIWDSTYNNAYFPYLEAFKWKIYTFRDIVNVDLNEGYCNEFKQTETWSDL